MEEMLFQAHSGLRYLVLLAGVIALVLLLAGHLGRKPYGKGARVSTAVFTGTLDLQVLLGLAVVAVRPWFGALVGHIVMMVLALVAAHGLRVVAKRADTDARRYLFALLAVIVPLVLIVGGIMAIGRPLL